MIHFAYPNANTRERKFIGCGRYAVLSSPEEGYQVADPKTANLTKVTTAALILATESQETRNLIYEKKDVPNEKYVGESLDFAYLLALINCSRPVKLKVQRDIWCTGSIDITSGKFPFLNAVESIGFDIKLEAFLSEENRDNLFIVPAPNIQPTHEVLFQESDVNVVSVTQFQNLSVQKISEGKTIVKVPGNKLQELIDVLFEPPVTVETPVRTWQYQTGDKVGAVAIDAEGKTIVAGTPGKKVLCLDAEGHLRWQANIEKESYCIALSPDGQTIVVGTWNRFPQDLPKRSLFCFAADGSLLWQDVSKATVNDLTFSADSQTVAAGTTEELVLFDISGKRTLLQDNRAMIWLLNTWTTAVALSANGEIVAAGTGDKYVRIFRRNGALLGEYRTQGDIYSVAMSANGEFVTTGDTEGYLYWLNQQGELLWKEHLADKIHRVALDRDGQQVWVGTGKKDGHLRVYDHKGRLLWRRHVGGKVRALALSKNGQRTVLGTEEGSIYIFSRDGTVLHQTSAGKTVHSVTISATGERIAAGSLDGVIYGFQLQQ